MTCSVEGDELTSVAKILFFLVYLSRLCLRSVLGPFQVRCKSVSGPLRNYRIIGGRMRRWIVLKSETERAKKSPYPMKSRERNGYSFISLFYWSDFNVCSNWADCTTSISIIYPCVATTTSIDLFWNLFAVYSFLFRFKAI